MRKIVAGLLRRVLQGGPGGWWALILLSICGAGFIGCGRTQLVPSWRASV